MLKIAVAMAMAVPLILLSTSAAPAQSEPVCLKHDDNSQENKRSITGAGHAVRFECPDDDPWYVTSVAVHGSRYGAPRPPREDFLVFVTSLDFKQVAKTTKPYALFKRGEETWVKFDIPPVAVPKEFQIVVFFNPTRSKGVYVGLDENSTPTHSMTVVPDAAEENQSNMQGDWMIQAYVTKEAPDKPRQLLSRKAQAAEVSEAEAAEDARLLGNAKSLTLSHSTGDMDAYLNVQGAVYTVEYETPKNVACYVWQVQIFASQFGGQHDSEAVNGDVYILDANRRIVSRTSFPYSLATQQKQWVTIPTLPTRVQGKFFVSVDAHGTKFKGLYMGYETGNEAGHFSTDEIQGDSIKPGDWSAKFADKQWMMRVKVADRPVVYGEEK